MTGNETSTPPQDSPGARFRGIEKRLRELGLLDKTLTLNHGGRRYLARCDAHAFSVYRLLDQGHLPPVAPGWPVCLVTPEAAVDETCPPHHPEDEFSSGLSLQDWLELIERQLAVSN